MPMGNNVVAEASANARMLLYGRHKTRKTWWALTAAYHGFNVLLLDGDKGHEIIRQMPDLSPVDGKPWKHRVRVITCSDTITQPVFCDLLTRLMGNYTIRWDDTASKQVVQGMQPNPEHAHFILEASKLTANDVLVVDSNTALVQSLTHNYFSSVQVDQTRVEKNMDLRGYYEYTGRLVNFNVMRFKGLKCHVVLIAHEGTHELSVPVQNEKGKWDRAPTGEVNTIIQSTSKNNSASLGSHFSDILYFNLHQATNYIDARSTEDREGGSRNINKEFPLDKLHMGDILKELGHVPVIDSDMPGCVYYAPGEYQSASARPNTPVIQPKAQEAGEAPKPVFKLGQGGSK